jgi:hypothetical protein
MAQEMFVDIYAYRNIKEDNPQAHGYRSLLEGPPLAMLY